MVHNAVVVMFCMVSFISVVSYSDILTLAKCTWWMAGFTLGTTGTYMVYFGEGKALPGPWLAIIIVYLWATSNLTLTIFTTTLLSLFMLWAAGFVMCGFLILGLLVSCIKFDLSPSSVVMEFISEGRGTLGEKNHTPISNAIQNCIDFVDLCFV